jgi:hypothetical protein
MDLMLKSHNKWWLPLNKLVLDHGKSRRLKKALEKEITVVEQASPSKNLPKIWLRITEGCLVRRLTIKS